MGNARVFGTSENVRSLANVVRLCMQTVSETNKKGKNLLSSIEGSQSDNVYQQAEEIVNYVEKAVEVGEEPLESVVAALNAYADLLQSHGK